MSSPPANPFRFASNAARKRGQFATARRIVTEGRIVHELFRQAIASHFSISINDGEEDVLIRCAILTDALRMVFTTDEDFVTFHRPGGDVGTIHLVYGNNGNDVISDWVSTDLAAFESWLAPVLAYAEEA